MIDLNHENIEFTIKGASLLLSITKNKDNSPKDVYFLSSSADIVKVEWTHLQEAKEYSYEDDPQK